MGRRRRDKSAASLFLRKIFQDTRRRISFIVFPYLFFLVFLLLLLVSFFFPVLLLKDLTRRLWVFQSIFFSVVVVCAPPISSASLLGLFCSTPFGGSMPLEFLRFFFSPRRFCVWQSPETFSWPFVLWPDGFTPPPTVAGWCVCGCTGKISRQLPGRDVDIFTCWDINISIRQQVKKKVKIMGRTCWTARLLLSKSTIQPLLSLSLSLCLDHLKFEMQWGSIVQQVRTVGRATGQEREGKKNRKFSLADEEVEGSPWRWWSLINPLMVFFSFLFFGLSADGGKRRRSFFFFFSGTAIHYSRLGVYDAAMETFGFFLFGCARQMRWSIR